MGWPKKRRPTSAQARPKPTARPELGSRLSSDADREDPRVSETGRGGEGDGGEARRRELLRRRQGCLRARLILADLGEPLVIAIDAASRGVDGHGGARPRHGRLRRSQGVSALMADSKSFRRVHRIQRKGEKGMEGARAARPRARSAGGGHGDPVEPRPR